MHIHAQLRFLRSRYEFIACIMLTSLLSIAVFIGWCVRFYGQDVYELVSADQLFLGRDASYGIVIRLLLPLVVSIPFADSYFTEKSSKTLSALLPRFSSPMRYYYSKLCVVFISSTVVILIPLLLNMALNLIAFPLQSMADITGWSSDETWYHDAFLAKQILYPNLFALHPYLYNLVFTAMLSMFSGMIGVFTFAASFFVKKNRVFVVSLFFIINSILELLSSVTQGKRGIVIAPFQYLFAWEVTQGKSLPAFAGILLVFVSATAVLTYFGLKKLEDML
jgi:hypothetical protein